jgi:hypothetical protein
MRLGEGVKCFALGTVGKEGTSASHLEQELLRNLDRFVGSVIGYDPRPSVSLSNFRIVRL